VEVRAEKVTEESGQSDCFQFLGAPEIELALSGVVQSVTESSGLIAKSVISAGTTAVYIIVPLSLPLARETASRGVKIASVALSYKIATAAATAVAGKIYKTPIAVDGAVETPVEVVTTKDIADASCYDADEHKVTWTVSTPVFMAADERWHFQLIITPANTSVVDVYGALVKFTRAL
jgi:hypothetical protein